MTAKTPTHLKKNGIVFEKLGKVGVPQCTQKYHILILVWVLALQGAGHDKNRLEGTHTEVVVVLL